MGIKRSIVITSILLIFVIGFTLNQSVSAEKLTISVEKTFYDDGQIMNISGTADPNLVEEKYLAGIPEPLLIHVKVTVQVISSAGNLVEIAQLEFEEDGKFSHAIITSGPQWNDPGLYTIQASQGKNSVETQFWFKFDGGPIPEPEQEPLQEQESKLPEWVKNIFIWYAEGQVGEDELINALQYLIKEGIIKV